MIQVLHYPHPSSRIGTTKEVPSANSFLGVFADGMDMCNT
ncbi:hypothetical protein [Pseudomonas fluorescens]|nr:hypothetical protein [Pseudomonas fluorescens]